LTGAQLRYARLIESNLSQANLSDCWVYGLSAWAVRLDGAIQTDLVITREGEPRVTVDNLDVAQFIYLLLDNERIRNIIDTITTKVVLILGRFTPGRKRILDQLRIALRSHNYLSVVFDFEAPASRSLTDTVSTLAHISKFVIADITEAKSIPQELQRIVPNLPSVPVQPLLESSDREYGMFGDFRLYPWVLPVFTYSSEKHLLASLKKHVIDPAEKKVHELRSQA
jgi:Pentapeptide repeats (8 copies)